MNDVEDLIRETSLDAVLHHYGLPPRDPQGREYRMPCVFNESCCESSYGNLSVATDAINRIYSHCCRIRGNLLTLIHGLEDGCPPAGGKLRGQEFKNAVAKLREIRDCTSASDPDSDSVRQHPPPADEGRRSAEILPANTPLIRHEKEAARKLADLCDDLISDPALMSPEAAQYVRSRSWMTSELMQKWGVGWLPGNGRSLFRKNYLVYTHRNQLGEIVSYSGRDLSFEAKHARWLRHQYPTDKKPNKHRYVNGFHRGQELYGGHVGRLRETAIQDSLARYGLVVVEGMNDVLRLDALGICAVGLGSNMATETQLTTIAANARSVANNRVALMPDGDEAGEQGFKELLWELNALRITTRLAVGRNSHPCEDPATLSPHEIRERLKSIASID